MWPCKQHLCCILFLTRTDICAFSLLLFVQISTRTQQFYIRIRQLLLQTVLPSPPFAMAVRCGTDRLDQWRLKEVLLQLKFLRTAEYLARWLDF
jgi:hypothetical protein